MEKFSELVEYMKMVREISREDTPEDEYSCPTVSLKNGYMNVFKLSNTLTANIYLSVLKKEFVFQIEYRGSGRIAVYPPNGSERSTIATYFEYDDDISRILEIKTEHKLADLLVENLKAFNS